MSTNTMGMGKYIVVERHGQETVILIPLDSVTKFGVGVDLTHAEAINRKLVEHNDGHVLSAGYFTVLSGRVAVNELLGAASLWIEPRSGKDSELLVRELGKLGMQLTV